jgi:2-dehydropantoate 2-reductase
LNRKCSRTRPSTGRTDEASTFHTRADHRHSARAQGRGEDGVHTASSGLRGQPKTGRARGELDNSKSARIQAVSQAFTAAGFKAPVVTDLRAEIWTKLWGNLSFNPISALTGATLAGICRHPLGRALAGDMMREAQNVGEALGVRFRIPLEKRLAGAEAVGEHKTSMLQDIEAKRPTEVAALVGSIIELGELVEVPTPAICAVYACVRLLENTLAQAP